LPIHIQSILTQKKAKKWFLSSNKYDPGCSSRIPDPDADFLPSRIPDPEVKKAPNPGSRIRIRNAEKKPLALQRDDPARQNMKFLHFFCLFFWHNPNP
jgi:hypothetical protein